MPSPNKHELVSKLAIPHRKARAAQRLRRSQLELGIILTFSRAGLLPRLVLVASV